MNTKSWINFILGETESALSLYYSYLAFNEAIKDEIALESANKNGRFWLVHKGAVWRSLFFYMGRLSDDGRDTKSFSAFQAHCIKNANDFSKESFLTRRGDVLELNPRFLENSEFPDKTALNELFSLASKHNSFLRAECKTIRNKVYAHAIYTEEHEFNHLFKNVKFSEIEGALLALWSIAMHLWQSFENARTIKPAILNFHEKEDIYRSTSRVLRRQI
ncbi:MAG: hypothetical protein Q7T48_02765 [Cellvibrio sp.]|uniref:AbiU2 domain-containing protein n=1 Tax=Cellvibrio sp. TaxID=1965322 RepID=UPI00271F85FA|nr:hypothetical protein [Cellvibrio sp.]